ncbi:polysaccharide biosynthesis C-terminal domain-containing protein, partial [Vibrio parahaemolyticus]
VLIAVVILLIGPWVLTTLYGAKYEASGPVLQIHVLALPFVFMAAVFSKFIIAENALFASLTRNTLGAVLNIALNFLLIPHWGILGS